MSPPPQIKLTSSPPFPPNFLQAITGLSKPIVLVTFLLLYGFPRAILSQLSSAVRTLNPLPLLSPWAWRDAIWSAGSPTILAAGDAGMRDAKTTWLAGAYGRVLEVGAGSGETIKYYDAGAVSHLYALEPFPGLLPHLRKAVAARGQDFAAKTTVVPLGIEAHGRMEKEFGLTDQSIDTLVLVQCLCSIPDPEACLAHCTRLLKPGGRLILIEHVAATTPLPRRIQDLLTPAWSFIANGCEINRDTLGSLKKLGCWDGVEVQRPDQQSTLDLVPHVFVKATKKE